MHLFSIGHVRRFVQTVLKVSAHRKYIALLYKIAPCNENGSLIKYCDVFEGEFVLLITCQVYEDVAPVVRQEAFRARSAGRQPSSQNTQEVLHCHLKHGHTTRNGRNE